MNNKEFLKTSKEEVRELNGDVSEEAQEAWRAGYLFAQKKIAGMYENIQHEFFMDFIEDFVNENLEVFEYNMPS